VEPPKTKKKKHVLGKILLVFLLAAFCVLATFLAFCRVNEPTLYHRLTDPTFAFLQRVQITASDCLLDLQTQAGRFWEETGNRVEQTLAQLHPTPTPEPEETEPEQAAAPPATQEPKIFADFSVTTLTVEDGREILTGGNATIPYYNQADEQWAEQPFGPDPIGRYGCGPTAMSMAVSSLTGQDINPAQMAAWANEAGYCSPGRGSRLSIVGGASEQFGLSCTSVKIDSPEQLLETLSNGGLIVALMGPGHFTRGGHFILLRGTTLSGEVLVADPNSRENSLALWDPQLILDEAAGSRAAGAPLWLVTATP